MATLIVNIGEYAVSNSEEDVIKTYALGSCVALIVYDKANKIGGLIHVALPDSSIDQEKRELRPSYFVDSGVPLMLDHLYRLGTNRSKCTLKLVGGASIMDPNNVFDIGKRNVLAVKKIIMEKQYRGNCRRYWG